MPNHVRQVSGIPPWAFVLLALMAWCVGPGSVARAQDSAVAISAFAPGASVRPGAQIPIAIVFDHDEGWHVHTNDPKVPREWGDFEAIPTQIEVVRLVGARAGPIQWPRTHDVRIDLAGTGRPVPYAVFEGRAVAYLPIMVDPGAASVEVELAVQYQACDDKVCQFPIMLGEEESRLAPIRLSVSGEAALSGKASADFAEFDPSVFANFSEVSGTSKPVEFNVFGRRFRVDSSGALGLFALLGLAALGGLILNFTPCVLPVIPIKILSISQAAQNPARSLLLGAVMSLGLVAFWLGIGWAIATLAEFKAISALFQTRWFALGVGGVILCFSLGMLGLFSTGLPNWVYAINPKHDSLAGSFLFGVMTAVLSTPCTAPFLGSAAAWATTQSRWITIETFGAIGAGMALPYLVLSANPGWLSRLPKAGKGSELVKKVMGLFMLAVAVFFLGTGVDALTRDPVDPPMRWHWWLIAAIVVGALAWMLVGTLRHSRSLALRGAVGLVAIVGGAGMVLAARSITDKGPIDWVGYTPQRFEEARARGDVIVMDFTAEWCLNCKALEQTVLHRAEIAELLKAPGVVAMKVDLTGDNVPGKKLLRDLKWVGIPLLAIFDPGKPPLEPEKLGDGYTPSSVREAIESARKAPGR